MCVRKRVMILSFTDHSTDPRVNRQIRYLKDRYEVVCAGVVSPNLEDVDFIQLQWNEPTRAQKKFNEVLLMSRRYEHHYWRYPYVVDGLSKLANVSPDVILANDPDTLPLALRVAAGAPVIYDAHEY